MEFLRSRRTEVGSCITRWAGHDLRATTKCCRSQFRLDNWLNYNMFIWFVYIRCILLLSRGPSIDFLLTTFGLDAPDAPVAPVEIPGSATSYTLTVAWNVPNGNAYAVDYYQLQYKDNEASSPTWTTVQCDNLGDGVISDWLDLFSSIVYSWR